MEKVILVIRDGWGYRESHNDNAISTSNTPYTDMIMKKYPNVLLDASGASVGLPDGYMGNSEVGHMTIGSGRILYQSLVKINNSITDGSFFRIKEFVDAINNCKKHSTSMHIIGLLQTQGVHSHIDHLFAILDLCKKYDFQNIYIHVITDGRDGPVNQGLENVGILLKKLNILGFGKIATICGRYYAMDRDKRRDRTQKYYNLISNAELEKNNNNSYQYDDPLDCLKRCYAEGETDEFINPKKLNGFDGININDSVLFYNFRTDRTRQITQSLIEHDFYGFDRVRKNIFFVAMTNYYQNLNGYVAFKDQSLDNLLGEVISNAGYKQLRISETEKYAHVTFFFNGQKESPFENEDRLLIDSPKVSTYDLCPEMSVAEIADKLVKQIEKKKYHFIVVNLVNGDMVGHTGKVEAIQKAIFALDSALEKIVESSLKNGYTSLIFGDHGNAEDQSIEWRTSHTINPVQFIVVSKNNFVLKSGKGLKDVAPTVLKLMGIKKPLEMSGESVIED